MSDESLPGVHAAAGGLAGGRTDPRAQHDGEAARMLEPGLLRYVWRHSKRQQVAVLALTIASFPLVYASLELPKIIINDALNGTGFPRVVLGVELGQVGYLFALSGMLLLLIVLINGLKWLINVGIGMIGERLLRRMRFTLFEHVMRFRMRRFRGQGPGQIIQLILAEIEPLGGFVGEVIATPAFQGGLLVVYAGFIFVQDFWLGLASVALYPLQFYLIPKLQAKVIRLNKARATNNRELADRIGEGIGSMTEINVNGTARWHLAQIGQRLHSNTLIRAEIFRRKFTIKFINNFLHHLTPFFLFSVGGYMVIKGRIDLGSLVAVLAAYKDISAPWKELLNYIQRWNDFSVRFDYVVDAFTGDDVHEPRRLSPGPAAPLSGDLTLMNVEAGPGSAGLTIPQLQLRPGETVAITGGEPAARETALRLIVGVADPAGGSISIGTRPLAGASLAEIAPVIAYVGPSPTMISGSVRDNLVYALFRRPPLLADSTAPEAAAMLREALATGNAATDPAGDWIDYEAAGVHGPDGLEARLLHLTQVFGLSGDLYSAALSRRIRPEEVDVWSAPILAARARLTAGGYEIDDVVEPWQRERFNGNGSLLSNLLFALPLGNAAGAGDQLDHPAVAEVIEASGGGAVLDEVGWNVAREFGLVVETVGADSPVLDRFPGYGRAEIQEAAQCAASGERGGPAALDARQRARLRALAARVVEVRDGLEVLDDALRERVLAARRRALEIVSARSDFFVFDEPQICPAQTLAESLFNGPRRYDRRSSWRRLDEAIEQVMSAEGLRDDLVRLGLGIPIGEAGLSASARKRVALVRAAIKRPRYLILEGTADTGSPADVAQRAAIRTELPDVCLIYAAATDDAVAGADRLARIDANGILGVA